MPQPRKAQISLDATPNYHIVSRCVRRAFLCGTDHYTGSNFDHRRQWLEDRILDLSQIFAIDVAAFAIMENHYHLVLHVDNKKSNTWESSEIIRRWHKLYSGTAQSKKHAAGDTLSSGEHHALSETVLHWQERLSSISWFMRCINEPLARLANKEDDCTGRFWEGRFKSQALLDEKALLSCMAYVDLNPIRAKASETPEKSEYTSIKIRIESTQKSDQQNLLFPFIDNNKEPILEGIAFKLSDYIELVEWTGRQIRAGKRGFIGEQQPPILERLNIETKHWAYLSTQFESHFKVVVGSAFTVKASLKHFKRQWMQGYGQCLELFGTT